MAGIQISVCVQLSGMDPGVGLPGLDTGFASYKVREMKITSFLDLLVLKVDITLSCSFI